jgi:hypothetical protein
VRIPVPTKTKDNGAYGYGVPQNCFWPLLGLPQPIQFVSSMNVPPFAPPSHAGKAQQ